MTNRELLTSAVALVCEDTATVPDDYEDRAPYLLASFYTHCTSLDAKYRQANGLSATTYKEYAALSLDEKFPLSPVLAPCAVYYLAAMLVLDENEVLSDKLFALYVNTVSELQASLPMTRESIAEVY